MLRQWIVATCFGLLLACRGVMPAAFSSFMLEAPQLGDPGIESVVPGTYHGYLRSADGQSKWPLTAELLLREKDADKVRIALQVRVALGSHLSHEYQSDYFSAVELDLTTHRVRTGDGVAGWSLAEAVYDEQGILRGKIQLGGSATASEFHLVAMQSRTEQQFASDLAAIYPKLDLAASVEGTYRGRCADGDHELQLETVKWRAGPVTEASFLSGYSVRGRWGLRASDFCRGAHRPCLRWDIQEGNINISTNSLTLSSGAKTWNCARADGALSCGQCRLRKVDTQSSDAKVETSSLNDSLRRQIPKFGYSIGGASTRVGQDGMFGSKEYFGYVFHEATGHFQFARLKLDFERFIGKSSAPTTVRVGGVATLFFGGGHSDEFIAYRLPSAAIVERNAHVLEGPGDAVVQISRWTEEGVAGIWYSKAAGRVGPFQLLQGATPEIDSQVLPRVSGNFGDTAQGLTLIASADVSDDDFDFSPLSIRGAGIGLMAPKRHASVVDVGFDPYRGRMALRFNDRSVIDGVWGSNGLELNLHSGARFGASLPEFRKQRAYLAPTAGVL